MKNFLIRLLAVLVAVLLFCPVLAWAAEPTSGEAVTLQEVQVSSTPLEKYLVTTSVITDRDIEAKGARNLAEALEDVPGLNLHFGRKNNTALDIRGVTSADTKIFIDGVLVNPLAKVTNSSSLDVSMFPVDNIAKIEVIKGPGPVIYGTDANGGVILITTKNGQDYQGGKISISGGSDDTFNGSLAYGGGNEKFNYYFNGGTEQTNGFRDNADRNSKYLNTKLSWQLKDDSVLTLLAGYYITDKGLPNGVDPVDGHSIRYTKGYWPNSYDWKMKDWEKSNLSLGYQKTVNEKMDYNVKVYRLTEKNDLWGYTGTQWKKSFWDSSVEGMELQSNLRLNTFNTLTFGTLYNHTDWKKTDTDAAYVWSDYKDKRYGYYLQDTFLPNDRTNITVGLRHEQDETVNADHNSIKKSATNPTINLVYQLNQNDTLRGSYGKTCSFPSVEQLYGSRGNPDLKSEEGENYELGLKHKFDQSLTGDIAVFKNKIENKIDTDPATKKFRNITNVEIKGMELELNKRFSSRLKGFVNYTYLDTKALKADGVTTRQLSYAPRNHINYGLAYQDGEGYNFSLTGHYMGERATWDEDSFSSGSPTDNRTGSQVYSKLPSYHVLDLEIRRQINENNDWFIQVNNIFDKQYQDELFYPAPGRITIFGLDYRL